MIINYNDYKLFFSETLIVKVLKLTIDTTYDPVKL